MRVLALLLFLLFHSTLAQTVLTEDDRSYFLQRTTAEWKTNWNKHLIEYDELRSGGPPMDGIPSIDKPKFTSPALASKWLKDNEPVIYFKIGEDVRAYPLQILIWHEIVNDTVGATPVLVTFCPLCNSAIVFKRQIKGKTYDFGTSGLLRKSDLVMYDRSTHSLWQQFTGEAIVGDMVGERLVFLPSSIISFADFKKMFQDGKVLSKDTGFYRRYGQNPYIGYDNINSSPFLYDGKKDKRLRPMERVVSLEADGTYKAYPLKTLSKRKVINDIVGNTKLVVFFKDGTLSALDKRYIKNSKAVGATAVFSRIIEGVELNFIVKKGKIFDVQTNSEWSITGTATKGTLKGKSLSALIHADHFWFSWAAFRPDTQIYKEKLEPF